MLKTEMGRLILREGKRRGVLKTEMGRLILREGKRRGVRDG